MKYFVLGMIRLLHTWAQRSHGHVHKTCMRMSQLKILAWSEQFMGSHP